MVKQAPQTLLDLARKTIEPMGFELVGVELINRGNYGKTLRVYIDHEKGITLDDCAAVSHQFSGVLDVEDPVQGNYDLEVSSPGLDRPLFEIEQFERFKGKPATVRLTRALDGRRKFKGLLSGIEEGVVLLEDDEGNLHRLPYDDIEAARLVPVFDD